MQLLLDYLTYQYLPLSLKLNRNQIQNDFAESNLLNNTKWQALAATDVSRHPLRKRC